MARGNHEIADDLDRIAGSLTSGTKRALAKIIAELRGEKVEPTVNEVAAAQVAQAQATQAPEDSSV